MFVTSFKVLIFRLTRKNLYINLANLKKELKKRVRR